MNLKEIPLLQGLSDAELGLVKSCLREKVYEKGEVLFHEGAGCERIFIVDTGRVKLYRTASNGREQILETLSPGGTCACNPGSTAWACSTSAEAMTRTKVWFFSRDDYVRMVKTNSKISQALNRLFAERLSRFSCLIEEVSLKDVKKRLTKFLLDMLDSRQTVQSKGASIPIPFTREEIAQRIGTARETVARHLYQLKRAKLIDIKPHEVIIRDRAGLEKLLL